MTSYIIRAALAEEANEGWVWLETKRPSRSVVKIKDCVTKHTVFCQIRKLDGNFIKKYNKNPSTINITNSIQDHRHERMVPRCSGRISHHL